MYNSSMYMKYHHEYDRNDHISENKNNISDHTPVPKTHTHTHTMYLLTRTNDKPESNIADTKIISALVKICNLWTLSSC